MTHTKNPERLLRVVDILYENKDAIDSYYHAYIFQPYNIDIAKCVTLSKTDDAKRLLDFSFTTRQGGQDNNSIEKYEKAAASINEALDKIIKLLVSDLDPKNKYLYSLIILTNLKNDGDEYLTGIGQKIATMFLKFLIYYSDEFKGRDELLKELFIPLDVHVIRLLYIAANNEFSDKLNLYDEKINQSQLKIEFKQCSNNIKYKDNLLVKLQNNIKADFDELNIHYPIIILDYLWYVGYFYCSSKIKNIGCSICFLKKECNKWQNEPLTTN